MKRFIPLILIFILLSAGCAFVPFTGADYNQGFEPQITGVKPIQITGSSPNQWGTIQDNDAVAGDVQGIIYIYFNDYMASSVVNATNFLMTANGPAGTLTSVTVSYEKNFRRAKITGTFANNATYSLKISASAVKAAGGCWLDGNDNGIDEGSPYDDVYYQFRTGGGTDWADHENPELWWWMPDYGQTDVATWIWLLFSELVESTDVVNNVKLIRESDGMNINLELVYYDAASWVGFDIAGGDSLAQRQSYRIEVNVAGITDSAGNRTLLPGRPYTSDTTKFITRFVTESWEGDDDTPPSVDNVTLPWEGNFMTIEFSEAMDITTLTSSNIKFYADFGYGPIFVPGEISIRPDTAVVEYSLINMNWDEFNQGLLVISKDVTDNSDKKWKLDANGNGIGGEDADLNRFNYEESDNYNEWF